MSKKPILSIVIPVYNSEKYIGKCLKSVSFLLQYPIEIIIINDGSTDNSVKICENFRCKYPNTTLISKKNEGVSIARNKGIELAQGQYVTFIDSDDWIDYRKYKKVIRILKKYKYDLISFNMVKVGAKQKQVPFKNKGACNNYIYFPVYMHSVCNKVFRKEFLNDNKIFFNNEIRMSEDLLFTFKCYIKAKNVLYYDENIYFYRDNSESTTHNFEWNSFIQSEEKVSRLIKCIVEEEEKNNEYNKYLIHRNTCMAMYYLVEPSIFSIEKFRSINQNKAEWFIKKELMHFLLCFAANHNLDIINKIFIYFKKKNNKLLSV